MFFKLLYNKFLRFPVLKNLSYIINVVQNPNLLLMVKNNLSSVVVIMK